MENLDKDICNGKWLLAYACSHVKCIPLYALDHAPIVLSIEKVQGIKKTHFQVSKYVACPWKP